MSIEVTHELKIWPEYFEEIRLETKKFEIRKDDRAFRTGDILYLREYLPHTRQYTGREIKARVDYILREYVGLTEGYVAMSISVFTDWPF